MLVLESLFCLSPPLYFGNDATTIQCVFFAGHADFFLQCVLSVSEYIKSLIGRLIFPLHTFCSLNGNCYCDPTTDSIVHLILMPRKRLGFVIPKTFPQFGYEMIIKKTAVFFPLLILFPFWFQIPHEHCSVFCWGPVMFKAVRSVCITRRPSLNNKKLWL